MEELKKFIKDQLSVWPLASANFRAMSSAAYREFKVGGIRTRAQFNPQRIASTTADISPDVIESRPCFLCVNHRPAEQFHIKFEGRKGRSYNVQLNPYPLFPEHLVIARDTHVPQSIWHHFVDMMDFARKYPKFLVFYNGPLSGASAPDHLHFQACHKGALPLQEAVDRFLAGNPECLTKQQDAKLYHFRHFTRGVYAIRATTPKSLAKLFYRLVDCAPMQAEDPEPKLNLFVYVAEGEFRCIVTLRSALRSHHYDSVAEDHLTMTFGAADMAGMFVCPKEEDFVKLTPALLESILSEVSISEEDEKMVDWRLTRTQPLLEVPILQGNIITFEMISDGAGPQQVEYRDGRIAYNGMLYDELLFDNRTRAMVFEVPSFILHMDSADGTPASRTYAGGIKFIVKDGKIEAVNRISLENYILSLANEKAPFMPSQEAFEEYVTELRTRVMNNSSDLPEYFGLSFDIDARTKKAVDITWGKTK